MTISDLMSKAKEGDSAAYGELYQDYLTPIFRFIYFRVKNREVAEDLAQTVFLKVLETKGNFQLDSLAKAYFYRTARNLVIDYWRKKKELIMEPEALNFHAGTGGNLTEEEVDKKIALVMVKNIIDQLDDKVQEVIVLKFVSELTNKEIATLLSKSEMAVRQLQCRALKQMREILKSYDKK